jgi:threonine/homoserine/homoserine lactone efflux protein
MSLSNVVLFFTTAVVMICTPGPDIIYVSTRGIAQGRGVALLSTFGVCIGYIVHTALAVLGLSAILQASAAAFEVVRYAGAAYLLYLGVRTLLSKESLIPVSNEARPIKRVVSQKTPEALSVGLQHMQFKSMSSVSKFFCDTTAICTVTIYALV